MSGLYQRALGVLGRKSELTPDRKDRPVQEAADISSDEQEDILHQIDALIEKTRSEIAPESFAYTPKYRGIKLPLAVNLAALGTVLLGGILFFYFFNQTEQTISANPSAIATAESLVIERLKEESQKQLSQKEREIADIRQRMEAVNEQRDRLALEAEATLEKREEELQAALELELAAERDRLRQEGISAAGIQERLQALEESKTREHELQLAALKAKAEGELKQKQQEFEVRLASFQASLSQAQAERGELQQELTQRTEELQQQFQEQERSLEQARSRAEEALSALQAQRAQEQLVMDQIVSFYEQVRLNLTAKRYAVARQNLASLSDYLNQEAIASLPLLQRRRPVELFLIDSLNSLIEGDQQPAGGAGREREVEQERFSALVASGDAHYTAGRFPQALDTYRQALAALAGDSQTMDRLVGRIQESGRQAERQEAESRHKAQVEALQAQIDGVEQKARERLLGVRQARERYRALSAQAPAGSLSEESLVELLQTKLLVKQIISSEPVSSQYPQLYEDLENYFSAFGLEQQQEGRAAALADLSRLLAAIATPEEAPLGGEAGDPLSGFTESKQQELVRQLLDRLEELVE